MARQLAANSAYRAVVRRSWVLLLVLGALGGLLLGCANSGAKTASPDSRSHGSVPLVLPQGSTSVITAAYVGVRVDGHRYLFRVDTGASRTVISSRIAAQLHLPRYGPPDHADTIGCATSVQPVGVSHWSLGDIALRPSTIYSQRTVAGGKIDGTLIAGLIGLDVLSQYKTVTLDFAGRHLILGGQPMSGLSVPMAVTHPPHGGVYASLRVTLEDSSAELLVDTGSEFTLLADHITAQNKLRALEQKVTTQGATGCSSQLQPVEIKNWSADQVQLPSVVGLSTPSASIFTFGAHKIQGLIGLSALSSFSRVTLDFASDRIVFGTAGGSGLTALGIAGISFGVVCLLVVIIWFARRSRSATTRRSAETIRPRPEELQGP